MSVHLVRQSEPVIVKKRAVDVTPHLHGIYCTVGDSKPFVNEIVLRRWSEDGKKIWFMLNTHNFDCARPEEEMDVVEIVPDPDLARLLPEFLEKDRIIIEGKLEADCARMMHL